MALSYASARMQHRPSNIYLECLPWCSKAVKKDQTLQVIYYLPKLEAIHIFLPLHCKSAVEPITAPLARRQDITHTVYPLRPTVVDNTLYVPFKTRCIQGHSLNDMWVRHLTSGWAARTYIRPGTCGSGYPGQTRMTNGGRLGKVGRVQGFLSRIYTDFGIFFLCLCLFQRWYLGESCSVEWR